MYVMYIRIMYIKHDKTSKNIIKHNFIILYFLFSTHIFSETPEISAGVSTASRASEGLVEFLESRRVAGSPSFQGGAPNR